MGLYSDGRDTLGTSPVLVSIHSSLYTNKSEKRVKTGIDLSGAWSPLTRMVRSLDVDRNESWSRGLISSRPSPL